MKKILKTVSIALSLLILIISLTACENGCNKGDNPPQIEQTEGLKNFPALSNDLVVKYTDHDFIVNNNSEYVIVLPKAYSENEMRAAQELNTFLFKACNVILNIKYDNEVQYSSESKFIVIGNSSLLNQVGIIPQHKDLENYGFILKTVGKSIFISGASRANDGALNGVYEFLRYQIGFDVYAPDEILFNKFSSIKLVDVDIADKPDIPGYIGSSYLSKTNAFMRRMRTTNRVGVMGNSRISPYHNMLIWLPPETYYADHPEWYNDKKTQLCLTAHGSDTEYQAMLDTVFAKMFDEVMTYDLDIVTWTLMDNYDACICKHCVEVNKHYGARSGKLVEFCNTLSDMFKEKFEQENIDKEITIMFFAYYYYTTPPTLGTIECRDNVYPIIAPYNEMDRAASIHSEKNANVKNTIETWSKMCKRFGFWVYSVNFNSYLAPFDPFSCLQENYAYFASKNPVYFFDEGFLSQFDETPPAFNTLKDYLSAKLSWDVNADVQSLTADFFTHYFKDASLIMYDYYTKYRLKLQILFENKGYTHNLNLDVYNTEFFEFGTLLSWQKCIDEAYKTIEKYKTTDYELYKKLDKRIRAEALTVDFMILKLYKSYYTSTEYSRLVDKFYADCSTVGLLSGLMWRPMENALPR